PPTPTACSGSPRGPMTCCRCRFPSTACWPAYGPGSALRNTAERPPLRPPTRPDEPSSNRGQVMNIRKWATLGMIALAAVLVPALLEASSQQPGPQDPQQGPDKKGDFFGKKGKGPGGFGFGFGGPGGQKRPLVKRFDKNGDGWLNAEE